MNGYCAICGKPAECEHHLVFGRSQRKLATKHHLTMDMCNSCHNMAEKATERIHGNAMAEDLSKMLGEALWLLNVLATEEQIEVAKGAFIEVYGRNYL